jgi:predicted nucleic acid-binding Zn ribbon protein
VARGRTEAVGAFVGGIVRSWEKRSGGPIERIIICWPDVVGQAIAANTRPFELDDKALIVEVRDTIWRDELARFYKGQILRKLNKSLGGLFVRDLRFRVAADPSTWETG